MGMHALETNPHLLWLQSTLTIHWPNHSILFHRGVYPAEDFYVEKRFGLDLTLILVSSVEDYIELTLHRLRGADF